MNLKVIEADDSWIQIRNNWLIKLTAKFVLFFILCSLTMVAIYWTRLPPLVPLWFSRPWGGEQLAPPQLLLVLPLGSLLIHLLNVTVGKYITSEYLIFTQILYLTSFVISTLSFFTLLKILVIVL